MKSTQFKWEEVSNSHGIFEKAPTYSKKVYSIKDNWKCIIFPIWAFIITVNIFDAIVAKQNFSAT